MSYLQAYIFPYGGPNPVWHEECTLCGVIFECRNAGASLMRFEHGQAPTDYGAMCPECLAAGKLGAASRARASAAKLRALVVPDGHDYEHAEHAQWLDDLAGDIERMPGDNWAMLGELAQAQALGARIAAGDHAARRADEARIARDFPGATARADTPRDEWGVSGF